MQNNFFFFLFAFIEYKMSEISLVISVLSDSFVNLFLEGCIKFKIENTISSNYFFDIFDIKTWAATVSKQLLYIVKKISVKFSHDSYFCHSSLNSFI